MHKDRCIDTVCFRCFCRCILPAPRELKRITSFLKISFLRCILPAPRELKLLQSCISVRSHFKMYLTRAAGIETVSSLVINVEYERCILPAPRELKPILNICLLFIFGRCILPALRELKHDIYRTFIILCHDVSYPHCGNVAAVALQGCAQPQNLTAVCRGGACPARNLP